MRDRVVTAGRAQSASRKATSLGQGGQERVSAGLGVPTQLLGVPSS